MRVLVLLTLLLALAAWPAGVIQAQPAAAPTIEAAEQAFNRGLQAYRAGQYGQARQAFERAATGFSYNQRTTAASLMAGKALYAAGELEEAAETLEAFVRAYPDSRYVDEARRVRGQALAMRDRQPEARPTDLGVVLPLTAQEAVFTQALFNGIRLAVDAHNGAQPERPVRIVFRDSGAETVRAGDAIAELARAGVPVVIGPLYSEEAIAAGGAAERTRVALVTPLATDARVSDGRRYVFQANPTFDMRGRMMARHAVANSSGPLAAVAVRGSFAETMAEAFSDEAARLGRSLAFFERLPSEEAWFQLSERVGADRLRAVDGLYLPVTGAGADDQAAGALRGLDQALGETATRPRLFGNSEWQGLRASRPRAARYGAVITTDFYPERVTPAMRAFLSNYRRLAGMEPDRLAFVGYDVGAAVLAALDARQGDEPLADVLRRSRPHEGLAQRIDFDGGQVNRSLYLLRFRDTALELVE